MTAAQCGRCHRPLKDPDARAAGYGRVCFAKTFGEPLPHVGKPKPARDPFLTGFPALKFRPERTRRMTDTRLWHGGFPGLKVGDFLLPPTESGTTRILTAPDLTSLPAGHVRRDRVHLTTDRAAGRAYAAAYPNGALYVAEPIGDTEPDPDAPSLSIRCERARVTVVYDPCVRWAERGLRWLRALTKPA
jgi:hypothetical protein